MLCWKSLSWLINDAQKIGGRAAQHAGLVGSREAEEDWGSWRALRKLKALPMSTSPSPERRIDALRVLTHCLHSMDSVEASAVAVPREGLRVQRTRSSKGALAGLRAGETGCGRTETGGG